MSSAEAICASIALPDELPPVRVSDSYTCNPTALAKVNTDIKINWSGASTGNVPEEDTLVMMFRDPLRWIVFYDPNVDGRTYRYNWLTNRDDTLFNGPAATEWPVLVSGAILSDVSDWNPHGKILFAGDLNGTGFMWVDQDVSIVMTDVGTAENGTMRIYQYYGGQKIYFDQQVFPGNTAITYTPTQPGYYAITFQFPSDAHSIAIYTGDPVGQHVWRHLAAPDVELNLGRIQSVSMSASSLLWRNTASYDNAQGNVGAVIVGPGFDWDSMLQNGSTPSYNTVSSLFPNGWKSFFAAKGIYSFLKPSDEEDIAFRTNIKQFANGTWSYARWNLKQSTSYVIAAMSVTNDTGRDTVLRAACHIQYESNDCWADTRVPEANVDDWLSAVKMLANVPNITENPIHVKDIVQAIGKVGMFVNNVQTRLAPLASAAASLIPGGSVVAKIGTASLPYQRKAFQYLSNYGDTSNDFDDGPRTNVDPRQM